MPTAVVTGAASGMGFATAEMYLARGWRVLGVDVTPDLGHALSMRGLAREAHEPAAQWAERVVLARPQSRDLVPLSHRFADARYAAGLGDPTLARELIHDLRRHHP